MGGMPGNLAKGRFFTAIDGALNATKDGKFKNRDGAITALTSTPPLPLVTVLRQFLNGDLSDADFKHLTDDWFGNGTTPANWWKAEKTQEIIRAGIADAIVTANTVRPNPLPMDVWWSCAGKAVEVATLVSDHQLTVLIMTPELPSWVPPPQKWKADEKVTMTLHPTRAKKNNGNGPFLDGFVKKGVETPDVCTVRVQIEE